MCKTCTFAMQCLAVATTEKLRLKALNAYEKHLRLDHRLSVATVTKQLEAVQRIDSVGVRP